MENLKFEVGCTVYKSVGAGPDSGCWGTVTEEPTPGTFLIDWGYDNGVSSLPRVLDLRTGNLQDVHVWSSAASNARSKLAQEDYRRRHDQVAAYAKELGVPFP